ncbi:hypothetical protein ElyMa_001019400 [Elysia marginata]|uniref:Peptidase S1 domain-containing protein n=1 Tax=Elysia marginata TaxID=1093978 RepID=A0AAV4HM06_9GAST|nr:hypothetical protein ElyMa_001019400 [Elysia marginata]
MSFIYSLSLFSPEDHECDVFGDGPVEEESRRAWEECFQNRNHENFIPARQFEMTHLPGGFQTDLHLQYVRYITKRTVRIKVGYVSWERPNGYTFSGFRGRKKPHWGSGWISDVSYFNGQCFCVECDGKPEPKTGCYQLKVHTARHVVFNTEEALHCEVHLYHEEKHPSENEAPTVLTFRGKQASDLNLRRDISTVLCVTHEETLFTELSTFREEKNQMWRTLREKAKPVEPSDLVACVIISHPHGQPKKITVGGLVDTLDSAGVPNLFDFYDGKTCRGSSGGPVIVWRASQPTPDPYMIPAPHSSRKDVNCSKSGGRPFFF